jgi:hypothetical protein
LKVARAEAIVFGSVDHDVESGEYKVSVSLQRFDSTKMLADSVRIGQGKIDDAETREKAMSVLVKKLCPTIRNSEGQGEEEQIPQTSQSSTTPKENPANTSAQLETQTVESHFFQF